MAALDVRGDFLAFLESEGVHFLLSSQSKVPLSSLAGKELCLFFSASWCRPCKSFTPQLLHLYEALQQKPLSFEILFVSFDHDDISFHQYLACMPWLALPFDLHLRRRLTDKYRVHSIPSLVPLTSDGPSLDEDLIALIEDYGVDSFPFTRDRIQQLKAADDAKRHGGKPEELLAHPGRNFLVSRDGRKTLVSQLVGKTIGLYFGAHWCPPCRAFTSQLKEAYEELATSHAGNFQVILVSTDRDEKEFDVNVTSMPWLAIPFEDRTLQDLCRIFNVKTIPALVLVGPDGKTISTNGKSIISLHGAKAYPFTETRIAEIEAMLRKEGDALPEQVKDAKHEHLLKLDMAKAYVCDYCKGQGRFWAFSCDVCDYDLHPSCVEEAL